ncbi:MAG: hypothetical protein IT379_39170, partial [Deltaproteobacteria bacterium]|nr:hypothetical protein [Deltaproteobacteria bacterium]
MPSSSNPRAGSAATTTTLFVARGARTPSPLGLSLVLALAASAACSGRPAPATAPRISARDDVPLAPSRREPVAATRDAPATAPATPATASGDAPAPVAPPHPSAITRCAGASDVALFVSPRSPSIGRAVRVMAVSDRPIDAALSILGPDGRALATSTLRRGGPPYWWHVEVPATSAGAHRAALGTGATITACKEIPVGSFARRRRAPPRDAAWRSTSAWDRDHENLYSAWIERLFDAPLDEQPSWRALHEITRDAARNFLHDHLALGEDAGDSVL